MRTFVLALVLGVLSASLALADPQRPRTTGFVTILGEVDSGVLPAAGTVPCGLVCDGQGQTILVTDGGVWSTLSGAGTTGTAATADYLTATITGGAQTTNIAILDHVKFDVVTVSNGSLITLDTATAYSSQNNVASIGRFTLKGGHTYMLSSTQSYNINTGTTGLVRVAWTNADTGAMLNQVGYMPSYATTSHVYGSANARVFFAPGADTRVELRIVTVVNFLQFGTAGYPAAPGATIFAMN